MAHVIRLENFLYRGHKKLSIQSKVDLRAFEGIPRYQYQRGLVSCVDKTLLFSSFQNGFNYDFVMSKKSSDKLFVVFSGYADRNKLNPPVFQRWKWVDRFPGNVLYVSDPSLYLSDKLALAWYIGTDKLDHFDFISTVVTEIAEELGIKNENIVTYGSSGGGYAAIRLGNFIPDICCVAINPQTEIRKYSRSTVGTFLRTCFQQRYDDFDFDANADRFSLLISSNENQKRVILAQNLIDERHYLHHYLPYCEARGVDGTKSSRNGRLKTILFKHNGGHSGAESSAVFSEIMTSIGKV